jgi:uncharacterized membrane protein YhaH (DUF805 family)
VGLIGDHLRSLGRFTDREPRQPFWLWVLVVMATTMVAWMAVCIPAFVGIFDSIEQFAREHPDQVTRTVGPGSYSIEVHGYHPELMPDVMVELVALTILAVMVVIFLAAAVVRRLHDGGRSGWWGIVPLPFLFCSLLGMSRLFATFPTPAGDAASGPPAGFFALFGLIFLNNLAYLATLLMLIIFCAAPSQPGDNRYGLGFGGSNR